MGIRKVVVTQMAAESIAAIALYIESLGLVATAEKFSDGVYDYFLKLADTKRSYATCREPLRTALGYNVFHTKRNILLCLLKLMMNQ